MKKRLMSLVLGGFCRFQISLAASGTGVSLNNALPAEIAPNAQQQDSGLQVPLNDDDYQSESAFFYWNKSHCEINGKTVPCDELLEDAFELSNKFFNSEAFQKNSKIWIPQLVHFWIIIAIIGAFFGMIGFAFWLRMLIDAIKYEKEHKMMWILIIVFFSCLGALVYLLAAKVGRKKEENPESKSISEQP